MISHIDRESPQKDFQPFEPKSWIRHDFFSYMVRAPHSEYLNLLEATSPGQLLCIIKISLEVFRKHKDKNILDLLRVM